MFVEDSAGDRIELSLYYVHEEQDPRQLLPVGSYLAVLEPYMRHTRDDPVKGGLVLRCDNPQACSKPCNLHPRP